MLGQRLKRLKTFHLAPVSELHKSISRSIFDDLVEEESTQIQTTQFTLVDCVEEPFTPTLADCIEEPLTPTEPDCAPTDLDNSSEESDTSDSLLHLARQEPVSQDPYDWPIFCEGPIEDSNDNQIDEQNATTKPTLTGLPVQLTGLPVHWSLEQRFQQDVDNTLQKCKTEHWFSNKIKFDELVDFGRSLQCATQYVQEMSQHAFKFKIGITENPYRRWHDPDFGYKQSHPIPWDEFAVIYTSPTSKRNIKPFDKPEVIELKQTSTGMMETLLIHIFEELPNCINRKGGGADCPSEGSPHFCYVVASYGVE